MEASSNGSRGGIRLAIVGAGFGRRVLLPAFRGDPRFSVVALCTRDEAAAVQAAQEDGVEHGFGDWRKLLETVPLDAMAIAVPPDEQPEIAAAALAKGIAVFCEKPLAASVIDAGKIAAAQNGVPAMIDFEFPEIPSWRQASALLESGSIGELREVAVAWNVHTRSNSASGPGWKQDSALGGGALQSFASHTFYYLERFAGPISQIEAALFRRGSGEADTLATLVLHFANGVVGTVRIATNAVCASEHRVELFGTQGRMTLLNEERDYVRGFRLLRASAPGCTVVAETESFPGEDDGRIHAARGVIRRFGDWIESGAPQQPSIADGYRVQRLIEAALNADQRRRPVEVPS